MTRAKLHRRPKANNYKLFLAFQIPLKFRMEKVANIYAWKPSRLPPYFVYNHKTTCNACDINDIWSPKVAIFPEPKQRSQVIEHTITLWLKHSYCFHETLSGPHMENHFAEYISLPLVHQSVGNFLYLWELIEELTRHLILTAWQRDLIEWFNLDGG